METIEATEGTDATDTGDFGASSCFSTRKGLNRSISCGFGPDTRRFRRLHSARRSDTFISSNREATGREGDSDESAEGGAGGSGGGGGAGSTSEQSDVTDAVDGAGDAGNISCKRSCCCCNKSSYGVSTVPGGEDAFCAFGGPLYS